MTGDSLLEITVRSIAISGSATLLALAWSLPLAYTLAVSRPGGRLTTVLEAMVGVPTVFIGLLLYLILSRSGPLGFLGLLYTPQAIIIGEAILVTPLITAVSYRVLSTALDEYGETVRTLGASESQVFQAIARESLPGLVAAAVMGFSRAIGELGVALIVGGNIKGYTRTITTSISLYVSQGEIEAAVKLGAILLALSIGVGMTVRLAMEAWAR